MILVKTFLNNVSSDHQPERTCQPHRASRTLGITQSSIFSILSTPPINCCFFGFGNLIVIFYRLHMTSSEILETQFSLLSISLPDRELSLADLPTDIIRKIIKIDDESVDEMRQVRKTPSSNIYIVSRGIRCFIYSNTCEEQIIGK